MTLCMTQICKKHQLHATYKMLEYDRIDISKGTDVNKTSAQVHQKNVIFVNIGILKELVLSMNRIFAMFVMI